MGGVVLEHDSKTILNEGIKIGKEELMRSCLEAGVDPELLARAAGVDIEKMADMLDCEHTEERSLRRR